MSLKSLRVETLTTGATSTPSPVSVSRHVLVDTLDANLQARAAVVQHVAQVPLQAVVWPRLYGDAHTLGVTPLRVPAE